MRYTNPRLLYITLLYIVESNIHYISNRLIDGKYFICEARLLEGDNR